MPWSQITDNFTSKAKVKASISDNFRHRLRNRNLMDLLPGGCMQIRDCRATEYLLRTY